MTGRPDLFPTNDAGFVFDDGADRGDAGRTLAWLAIALSIVVLALVLGVWWLDRKATSPNLPTVRHALAKLEERP